MDKGDYIELGVRYGTEKRKLKNISNLKDFTERVRIIKDLKWASIELLHFLNSCEPKNLLEYKNNINTWLSLEAKSTGYKHTPYVVGDGENLFKKAYLEDELASRKKDDNTD